MSGIAGKTLDELTPEQRIAVRPLLIQSLRQTGATVFTNEVSGHLIAIVMPADHEVLNGEDIAVFLRMAEMHEKAAAGCREVATMHIPGRTRGKA